MIFASRKIIENSNKDLLEHTAKEMEWLEGLFYENTEELDKKIHTVLNDKKTGYIEEINSLLNESNYILEIRKDLQVLKKILKTENYEKSVFSKLEKVEDIYVVYKQISLLLKRFEFGYIKDLESYLESICETYGLYQDDILVVLEVDTN